MAKAAEAAEATEVAEAAEAEETAKATEPAETAKATEAAETVFSIQQMQSIGTALSTWVMVPSHCTSATVCQTRIQGAHDCDIQSQHEASDGKS